MIEARDLHRSFDGVKAVDGLDLSVEKGEIYALVGPDGAGKTTTMRLLCGALRLDAGSVRLAGFDLASQTEQARECLGYLPQRFSLYGEMTVLENLRFFAEVRGLPRRDWAPRAQEILEFVDLAEYADRKAQALSGGMRQKLGLAAALVHRPPILLLDEPTGGVDPVTRQGFWQLVIRLLGQGVAVLISTPYMDEASRCSRVGFLIRGRLLIEGTPTEVVRPLTDRILGVVGEPRRAVERLANSTPGVEDVQGFGDRLHLRVGGGQAVSVIESLRAGAVEAGVDLREVRPIAPSLEDAFIELLRRGEGGGASAA